MKLVALSDFFVKGVPAARGEIFSADAGDAKFLCNSHLARQLTPEEAAAVAAEEAQAEKSKAEPEAVVEVASASPQADASEGKRKRSDRTKA